MIPIGSLLKDQFSIERVSQKWDKKKLVPTTLLQNDWLIDPDGSNGHPAL